MSKYFKFFDVAYLVLAIILAVETFNYWNQDRQRAYIFLALSALAVFMYFFRKKYRKRFENQDKNK